MLSLRVLEAQVQQAKTERNLAAINKQNTPIAAPRDGQIGEAYVRPEQDVSAGSNLMSLVPQEVWGIANFKETQTTGIEVGQLASIKVDALNGATLKRAVDEIAPATGSEFSLLRADNASGNFTKVVQRIPIRTRLDPDQDLITKIRPGMSVRTSVDTSE